MKEGGAPRGSEILLGTSSSLYFFYKLPSRDLFIYSGYFIHDTPPGVLSYPFTVINLNSQLVELIKMRHF